jgi:hypothetical protein
MEPKSMLVVADKLKVKSYLAETNTTSECEYTFIDDKTLQCKIVNQNNDIIIYKKVK